LVALSVTASRLPSVPIGKRQAACGSRGSRSRAGGKMARVPARALFHTGPRRVEIRELPVPRPAAGEVLVRTLRSGISGGTERLVYRGEIPAELALDDTIGALGGTFSYPFAYGYACVGEIAESGHGSGQESGQL